MAVRVEGGCQHRASVSIPRACTSPQSIKTKNTLASRVNTTGPAHKELTPSWAGEGTGRAGSRTPEGEPDTSSAPSTPQRPRADGADGAAVSRVILRSFTPELVGSVLILPGRCTVHLGGGAPDSMVLWVEELLRVWFFGWRSSW